MFQLIGFAVVVILALYGALHLGWLPAEWADKLPGVHVAAEMADNIDMPYEAGGDPERQTFENVPDDEKSFTERITGERNPNR